MQRPETPIEHFKAGGPTQISNVVFRPGRRKIMYSEAQNTCLTRTTGDSERRDEAFGADLVVVGGMEMLTLPRKQFSFPQIFCCQMCFCTLNTTVISNATLACV